MRIDSLKPFGDSTYLSEEESLKLIESIPIPKDNAGSESANPAEVKPGIPKAYSPVTEDNPLVDLESRILLFDPAYTDIKKNQNDWIAYCNDRNEIMVSMPDLYLVAKSDNNVLCCVLREEIKWGGIVTSTKIIYEDNQYARIIHHYGSKLIKPVEYNTFIPEYRCKLLADVLGTKEGLDYLQALFGTKDGAEQIENTLQKLRHYELKQIEVTSEPFSDGPKQMASCIENSFFRSKDLVQVNDVSIFTCAHSRGIRIGTPDASKISDGVK